jgi:hypothetical protein
VDVAVRVGEPWILQMLGSAVRGMLRHERSAPERPAAGAGRVSPSGPATGYADREAYLELEFAVGFAADDEPWL